MTNLLVDTNSIGSRAFFTGVLTFFSMLEKVTDDVRPDYTLFAFDSRNNWRKGIYPEYKANRKPKNDGEALQKQLRVKYLAKLWYSLRDAGFNVLAVDGFEADDLIASLATPNDYVLTGDKDLLQLCDVASVIYVPAKFADRQTCDQQGCIGLTGYAPNQLALYKALVGEKTDNIPGTRKIGPVTAAKLLPSTYSILCENPLVATDLAGFTLSYKLASLRYDVPVTWVKQQGDLTLAKHKFRGGK